MFSNSLKFLVFTISISVMALSNINLANAYANKCPGGTPAKAPASCSACHGSPANKGNYKGNCASFNGGNNGGGTNNGGRNTGKGTTGGNKNRDGSKRKRKHKEKSNKRKKSNNKRRKHDDDDD